MLNPSDARNWIFFLFDQGAGQNVAQLGVLHIEGNEDSQDFCIAFNEEWVSLPTQLDSTVNTDFFSIILFSWTNSAFSLNMNLLIFGIFSRLVKLRGNESNKGLFITFELFCVCLFWWPFTPVETMKPRENCFRSFLLRCWQIGVLLSSAIVWCFMLWNPESPSIQVSLNI